MTAKEVLVFEVSKNNFNTSVVLNSHKLPVLVEFMGVWSGPCIQMADRLAELATEFAGQFVFAKVDVDEQPALKKDYDVENVPCLKIFKDGEVVRTEEGLLNDTELRELLKSYGIYNQSDELRNQARQKHMSGDTIEAIALLTKAIQNEPKNTRVAMDMVQIFLDINELGQAKALFGRLPESDRLSDMGKSLLGQITFKDLADKTAGKEKLKARLSENASDFDACFDLAICLVAEHNYTAAMDSLFVIFEQNPEYKEGAAKEMIVNLSNMLAVNEPELAKEFRQRMGSALS
ncbi:MAG: tetratricopeptide repeat protein [Gammaproteobacteria bacterium]|nr:tetratricopeptide repeat protein [Gammaproteobacteria bacterium]